MNSHLGRNCPHRDAINKALATLATPTGAINAMATAPSSPAASPPPAPATPAPSASSTPPVVQLDAAAFVAALRQRSRRPVPVIAKKKTVSALSPSPATAGQRPTVDRHRRRISTNCQPRKSRQNASQPNSQPDSRTRTCVSTTVLSILLCSDTRCSLPVGAYFIETVRSNRKNQSGSSFALTTSPCAAIRC